MQKQNVIGSEAAKSIGGVTRCTVQGLNYVLLVSEEMISAYL